MPLPAKCSIRCIGAPISAGAPFRGTELGAAELRSAGLAQRLTKAGIDTRWETFGQAICQANELGPWLSDHAALCAQIVRDGDFPLILGGDHSIAAATWRGVGRALGQAPGLLWIDAHLDAHTPLTSPSGNLHGMPVAALLGEGNSILSGVAGPSLEATNLVLLAGHSYEPAELELLRRLGVTIHLLNEIRERSLCAFIDETCRNFGERPWGVSLDIDAVDPLHAPGVSTPVAGGLLAEELLSGLKGICCRPGCVALEIAEFNPECDQAGKTCSLIESVCQTVFAEDPAQQP